MATYFRRYALVVYWALFAAYTLYMAQFPGLTFQPQKWTYPWNGIFATWGLLAILIGLLHLILRPMTYHRSWGRLFGALVYGAVLLALGILSVVTDMPGYYYVFAMFTVVTMALLLMLVAFQAVSAMWQRSRHAA